MTGKLDAFGWATSSVIWSWQVPARCVLGLLPPRSAADPSLPEPEAREPRTDVAEHGGGREGGAGDRVSEQCRHTWPEPSAGKNVLQAGRHLLPSPGVENAIFILG